jgi:hypothetical protein
MIQRKRSLSAPRFLTILTGHNLPKIWQSSEPEPSIINQKTITDFTRVVEQTGILEREPLLTARRKIDAKPSRAAFAQQMRSP